MASLVHTKRAYSLTSKPRILVWSANPLVKSVSIGVHLCFSITIVYR